MLLMAVRKLSVALDEAVAAEAAEAAEEAGLSLSAWLNQAAQNFLAVQDGLASVAAFEAEHGAFTEEEMAEAHAELDQVLGPAPRRGAR